MTRHEMKQRIRELEKRADRLEKVMGLWPWTWITPSTDNATWPKPGENGSEHRLT